MLEGFTPSHPSSWTAQDLVEAGDTNKIHYTNNKIIPRDISKGQWPLNSEAVEEEERIRQRERNIEQQHSAADLSISLDFLQQAEEDEEGERVLTRGRLGPRQIRAYPHLSHLSADSNTTTTRRVGNGSGSSFGESPETDSSPGSEQEWRRTLAAQGDPIYKSGHRSSSRDPPGLINHTSTAINGGSSLNGGVRSQYSTFGVSPPIESSSPSSLSSFGARVENTDTFNTATNRSSSLSQSTSQQGGSITWGGPFRRSTDQSIPTSYSSSDAFKSSLSTRSNSNGLNHTLSPNQIINEQQSSLYQRPLPVHRSFTTNTNNNSSTFSMSSSSPDRNNNNRLPMQSSISGLPTMHEEGGSGGGGVVENHLSSMNTRKDQDEQESDLNRLPRHRSTSSAAALQHDDRSSLFKRETHGNGTDTFQRSVSLWRGELGGMSPGSYARAAAISSSSSPPSGDQGSYQFQTMSPPTSYPSPPSSSSRWDRGRYGNTTSFDAFPEEEVGVHGQSNVFDEMNQQSMTAGGGQRRAIGFEVNRPIGPSNNSRTTSVGRQTSTPRIGDNFSGRLFNGGGGLAITDDDLGSDFQNLRLNLDDVAIQRQQDEDRRRMGSMRVPSSNAAMSGIHAASVPSGFGGGPTFANFGQSPPIGSSNRFTGQQWPVSARLRDEDSTSNWSEMIPSPSNRSNFTESSSQGYQNPHHNTTTNTTTTSSQQSSSTNQPSDERKFGLSANAKVFQGGSTFAETARSPPFQHNFIPSQRPVRQDSRGNEAQRSSISPHRSIATSNTLSEGAIASLVTLGPLAPASGGPGDGGGGPAGANLQELGKGVPLQMLPRSTTLFIVEFKEGRTDLYFRQPQAGSSTEEVLKGDLVIVEADRGKDLGTVVNDSITVDQVQTFLAHQSELVAQQAAAAAAATNNPAGNIANVDAPHPAAISLSRLSRSMNPKRLFAKAGPADTSLLHSKAQDEERALTLCTTKVNQRGLPMTVVAAELQWDRRKLTFYYTATQRVDFRDLVKELFRLYKTRIWMCHLSHPSGTGGMP